MYRRTPGEYNIYTSLYDPDRSKSANPNVYFYKTAGYPTGFIYQIIVKIYFNMKYIFVILVQKKNELQFKIVKLFSNLLKNYVIMPVMLYEALEF